MRQKQTFLLTVISSETEEASMCGRLKVISSGKTSNFACVEELYALINSEMEEETPQKLANSNLQYPISPDAQPSS
ncbi:MAG: hypothetical protein IH586_09430 [Anaerolineaceae bacterium]|nr:hypothetical protein [Anaerolineaceae bacterium]